MQTPDGSLLDISRNAHDLLSECNIKLPKVYLLKISSINAWQLSYPPSNCTVDIHSILLVFVVNSLFRLFQLWYFVSYSELQIEDNSKYLDSGPPFLILLHPALGPLWEVTRKKVCS